MPQLCDLKVFSIVHQKLHLKGGAIMLKKIFASDPSYKNMTSNYNTIDAFIAIGLYIIIMMSYLGMGIFQAKTGINLGIYVSVALMALCIVLVIARKQKLDTIGLTKNHFIKALLTGFVAGACFSLLNIIPAIQSGGKWTSSGLLVNIFYYLVIIGLQEEILFRGYIQPRLYGIIKSDALAVILGGIMFATMHIPYQMYNRGIGNFIDFVTSNYVWLILTFMWHTVFNYLYRRFNSLTAPTVAHWLMNLSNTLFK